MIVKFPSKLDGLVQVILHNLVRWIVLYGGRSSSKSWSAIRALVIVSMSKRILIVACRDTEKSIKNSIHRLIKNMIDQLKLTEHWTVTEECISCQKTGSEFVFIGLVDNPDKIRSFEGADVCLVEESAKTPRYVWRVVIPTIRKPGSIIMVVFNPDWEDDETYTKFVKNADSLRDEGLYIREINYLDNPFCDKITINEAARAKALDIEEYENVWLGKPKKHSKQQVFKGSFLVEEFDVQDFIIDRRKTNYKSDPEGTAGIAWGYSQKPTAALRVIKYDNCLYIDHCAGGVGIELKEMADAIKSIEGIGGNIIYGCPSQPATLKKVQTSLPGIFLREAEKWDGDVIDAIIHLRGAYERIIIHPRCTDVIDNFKSFWWELDDLTGEIKDVFIDENNQYIHALRHALHLQIRGAA